MKEILEKSNLDTRQVWEVNNMKKVMSNPFHDFYDELFTHVQKAFKVDFGINYFKN